MTQSYPLPSFEEVSEWLFYCPITGDLIWQKDKTYNAKAGQVAGAICPTTGYRRIRFGEGRKLQGHRVAWLMHYGVDPYPFEIDHIDGNRHNNKIGNLRLATKQQNQFNRKFNRNNSSGYRGVYPAGKKWMAAIRLNGHLHHLGRFNSAELASSAWQKAASTAHGEFLHDKKPR
jgi:hypothetical protein